MRQFLPHTFTALAAALTLATTAHASIVWQYEGAAASSNEWQAARAGSTLVALHGPSNGWNTAEIRQIGKHRAIGFPEGASAFTFQEDATLPVTAVYAVVRWEHGGGAPSHLSCPWTEEGLTTLIEAPYNVCIRLTPPLFSSSPWQWQTEQLGYHATYRINGVDTARFEPSPAFQLIEVRFENPPIMNELYIGNAAASPLWLRHFSGDVGELLFFTTRAPAQQEQHAIYNYFRLKWGIPLDYERVDAPHILDALGVRRGNLFSTTFMVR